MTARTDIVQHVQSLCEERDKTLPAAMVNGLCDHVIALEQSLQHTPKLQRFARMQPLSYAQLLKPAAAHASELGLPMGPENKLLTFILQGEQAIQGILWGLQHEMTTLHETTLSMHDTRGIRANSAQEAFNTARTALLKDLGMPQLNKQIDKDLDTIVQSLARY